jgi:hypothetical protein
MTFVIMRHKNTTNMFLRASVEKLETGRTDINFTLYVLGVINITEFILKLPVNCRTAQAEASVVPCVQSVMEKRTASGNDQSLVKKKIPNLK